MSSNHKKDWVGKVSHLRKVRKSNKLFKSANLRNCGTYCGTYSICGPPTFSHGKQYVPLITVQIIVPPPPPPQRAARKAGSDAGVVQ